MTKSRNLPIFCGDSDDLTRLLGAHVRDKQDLPTRMSKTEAGVNVLSTSCEQLDTPYRTRVVGIDLGFNQQLGVRNFYCFYS